MNVPDFQSLFPSVSAAKGFSFEMTGEAFDFCLPYAAVPSVIAV